MGGGFIDFVKGWEILRGIQISPSGTRICFHTGGGGLGDGVGRSDRVSGGGFFQYVFSFHLPYAYCSIYGFLSSQMMHLGSFIVLLDYLVSRVFLMVPETRLL